MSELRIRIRLGEHEIELEGSAEAVERQFEPFKRMLMQPEAAASAHNATTVEFKDKQTPPPLALEKILRWRGTICSLAVTAKVEDAILVILLGQRHFRRNESVSGIEIMQGLRDSGIRVLRVDMILIKYVRLGIAVSTGQHRRRRYRLTAAGLERAQQIARALMVQVPSATG